MSSGSEPSCGRGSITWACVLGAGRSSSPTSYPPASCFLTRTPDRNSCRGVLQALIDVDDGQMRRLAVGERCGITVPTRYALKNAGYYGLKKAIPQLRFHHFDEEAQVEIPLSHPDRLRDSFFTPRPIAEADFFVNCPKFKAHPWTTVTFAMKNYIGIQDDRHRLIDHDHQLNAKVADLQYIVQPQFIAIDAITAGEGRMLTPVPFDLGLVIMGNNQVAFDAVCCHIIGQDPLEVEHIRLAYERGFGPIRLDDIEISGDVDLEAAQIKAEGFEKGLIRVEDYFADTNIRAYGGRPPSATHDYCWGGCPGALEEAIEVLRVFDAGCDDKIPPLHIVFGAVDTPIDAKPGEKVVFMGDCASYSGEIAGRPVQIGSRYIDRSAKDPLEAATKTSFARCLRSERTCGATAAGRPDCQRLPGQRRGAGADFGQPRRAEEPLSGPAPQRRFCELLPVYADPHRDPPAHG